jgi:hypothetical protein
VKASVDTGWVRCAGPAVHGHGSSVPARAVVGPWRAASAGASRARRW